MSLPLVKRGLIALCLTASLVVPPMAAQAQPAAVSAQSSVVVHAKKAKAFTKSPRPSISGSPTVGAVLKVVRGTWKPKPAFTSRWQIDGNTVPGATQSSYTIRTQDAGSRVTVVVRAKKSGYRTTERTSRPVQVPAPPASAPVPTSVPSAPAPTSAPPAPTPTTVPPAPVPTATPPAPSMPPSNVAIAGDGDYRVGITIAPGTYVTSTSTSSCYWERVTSFDGLTSSIVANDFGSGQRIVTVRSSDYGVSFSHCGTWLREADAPAASGVTTGQYFVGSQIAPGLYLASPSSSGCYWALLSDFDGSSASIISNDYRSQAGAVYVQVGSAVRGFESSNCGNWTRVSS